MAMSTPSALGNNDSFMALIDLPVSLTKDFWPMRNKSRESVREKSRDAVKHYLPHVLVVGTYLLLAALTSQSLHSTRFLSDINLTPWTAFHPHLKIQFCIFAL
jgi:hypothetical protein